MQADLTHSIRSRFDNLVLFECEVPADLDSSLRTRHVLEQATKARADLSGAYLSDADLSGANLSGANLSGADLSDADLSGAYLSDAYLPGANLSGANLSDANLSDADLSGAYLSDAYLRGAYLRGANLSGANLSDAYLSDAYLSGADLSDADLSGADLRGADLSGACLNGADLSGADLSGAYLSGADLSGAGRATDEQAIANLDKVREVILDDKARLDMGHWHADESQWQEKSCAEEMLCGTTHCLAGWLQVCSTDPKVRALAPDIAGIVQAPVAAKMFYRGGDEVLSWLTERKYVADIEQANKRRAELEAKKVEAQ